MPKRDLWISMDNVEKAKKAIEEAWEQVSSTKALVMCIETICGKVAKDTTSKNLENDFAYATVKRLSKAFPEGFSIRNVTNKPELRFDIHLSSGQIIPIIWHNKTSTD